MRLKLMTFLLCILLCFLGCSETQTLKYVDTEIGAASVLLQPTRPTVHLPNKMIRWTPSRADILDECIRDYPLTMASHRLESVFGFLPIADSIQDASVWHYRQICDSETSTPYSYRATLEGCTLRFAPAQRSGIVELEFERGEGWLKFRALNGDGSFETAGSNKIYGEELFHGMKAYCCVESDCPLETAAKSPDGQAILLHSGKGRIKLRYGISYISREQAEENLRREIGGWKFSEIEERARCCWEQALGKIKVRGGSERDRRLFYSSLYRCHERPVDISEYGRYFSAFDSRIHEGSFFYTDNWLWDTYIALEPLHMIINPDIEEKKLQSYVEMYKQCGTVPSFAVIWGDWPAMTGNYAAVWMADARAKGLEFDLEGIYQGLKDNSLESTLLPWRNGPKTELDNFYNEKGWFPALHPGEAETVEEVNMPWERRQSVSLSTAFSYADWAVAQLARELGRSEDEALFLKRAAYYRNVYNPEKGMFWPKDIEGRWIEGTDPRYMDRAYFTENNAYTFQWDVKHDLEGLFNLMGGREQAGKKLEELFHIGNDIPKYKFYCKLPDATGMVGQFAMGNEPGFHIPYLFNYTGEAWKTQKHIRRLIERTEEV